MSLAAALLLAALAAVAGLWLAGWLAEGRRAPLDDATRAEAPGRFVDLPPGRAHLRDTGGAGEVVVLVHGLSTPSDIWTGLARALQGEGCRVLAPDLWGRGWSDRPARAHDAALYVRQIADLLDMEGVAGPVRLVGYSMGGAVVTAFADRHPERVSGIALLAPAGFRHGLSGLYAICARLPWIGDAIWSLAAGPMLRHGAQGEAQAWPDLPAIMARETARRGTLPAQLSSLRHLLGRPMGAAHRRVAGRGTPVLAIWGACDTVIPVAGRDALAAVNPQAAQVVLEDAGHGLVYTHAAGVREALSRWLARG